MERRMQLTAAKQGHTGCLTSQGKGTFAAQSMAHRKWDTTCLIWPHDALELDSPTHGSLPLARENNLHLPTSTNISSKFCFTSVLCNTGSSLVNKEPDCNLDEHNIFNTPVYLYPVHTHQKSNLSSSLVVRETRRVKNYLKCEQPTSSQVVLQKSS